MTKNHVNPILALAFGAISLSAIALSQPVQAMPQIILTTTVSITPESSTGSLYFLSQPNRTNYEKRPPRPNPPGGSR